MGERLGSLREPERLRPPRGMSLGQRQARQPCVGGAAASWPRALGTHNPWPNKR